MRGSNRLRSCRALSLLACLGATDLDALAADFPIGLRRADQAAVAMSRLARRADLAALPTPPPPPPPEKTIVVGLAWEHDQDGSHAVTTPFLFDYLDGPWEFAISGAGYTHAVSGDKTLSGVADVDLAGQYAFAVADGWSVTPGLGVTVPVGGEVGTRHLAETGQLLLAFSPDAQWTILAGGTVSHSGGAPPGVSAYSNAFLAKARYTSDATHVAFIAFKRSYTRGAGGSSTVIAEIDLPWATTKGVALSVSQGLSSGKRFTAIEFDLAF